MVTPVGGPFWSSEWCNRKALDLSLEGAEFGSFILATSNQESKKEKFIVLSERETENPGCHVCRLKEGTTWLIPLKGRIC